ncbi:MAG: inner membrane-spanning protein YciB [Oceanococcus sp.]
MHKWIDSLPALAFLGAVIWRDIYFGTLVLIVSLFALVLYYAIREKRLHKMHFGTAMIALVLGGITLAVKDPMFIKFKPTAVYAVFAILLAGSHFVGDKVIMQRLGHSVLELPDALWRKVNVAWALFFIFCAGLNVVLALNLSDETWALVKTFGFTGLMFVFMLAHLPFVSDYLPKEDS